MSSKPVRKVHPASREMLPDDPLETRAMEFPGDPELMLRLLVEEYAHMGVGAERIMQLARDPHYQAFHRLFKALGERNFERAVEQIIARCGVVRVRSTERDSVSESLVQLNPPDRSRGADGYGL